MTTYQAAMFIEQILSLPNYQLAAQYVTMNAASLDDTFFLVLAQMIQQEQARSTVDPALFFSGLHPAAIQGLVYEAETRRIRLQHLVNLYNYAQQVRQQSMSAPWQNHRHGHAAQEQPAAPQHPGIETEEDAAPASAPSPEVEQSPLQDRNARMRYWIDKIQSTGSVDVSREKEQVRRGEALDDLGKLRLLNEINHRYRIALARLREGEDLEARREELLELRGDCERLRRMGPGRTSRGYNLREVEERHADVTVALARTQGHLGELEQATSLFNEAAAAHSALGQAERAAECRAELGRLRAQAEGRPDAEFEFLTEQAAQPGDALQRARALIEGAELRLSGGDDYEAEAGFKRAQEELDRAHRGPLGGEALADTLSSALRGGGADSFGSMLQVTRLRRRILAARVDICARKASVASSEEAQREHLEQAQELQEELKELEGTTSEGSRHNDAFSKRMLETLKNGIEGLDAGATRELLGRFFNK